MTTLAAGLPDAARGSLVYMTGNTTYLLPPPTTDGATLRAYASATDSSGLIWTTADLTCTASGAYSHAEGYGSLAQGSYSHAEGYYTEAYGNYSHAEGGFHTNTQSNYAHAEGYGSSAIGQMTHAGGYGGWADIQTKWARAGLPTYATENTGPSQTAIVQISARTVDATPTNLLVFGGGGGNTSPLKVSVLVC